MLINHILAIDMYTSVSCNNEAPPNHPLIEPCQYLTEIVFACRILNQSQQNKGIQGGVYHSNPCKRTAVCSRRTDNLNL